MNKLVFKISIGWVVFQIIQWILIYLLSTMQASIFSMFIDRESVEDAILAISWLETSAQFIFYLSSFVAFLIVTRFIVLNGNKST